MRKSISAPSKSSIASSVAVCVLMLISVGARADQPAGVYTVKDGNKVDEKTLEGWKTWRAMACERCHGPLNRKDSWVLRW